MLVTGPLFMLLYMNLSSTVRLNCQAETMTVDVVAVAAVR